MAYPTDPANPDKDRLAFFEVKNYPTASLPTDPAGLVGPISENDLLARLKLRENGPVVEVTKVRWANPENRSAQ